MKRAVWQRCEKPCCKEYVKFVQERDEIVVLGLSSGSLRRHLIGARPHKSIANY